MTHQALRFFEQDAQIQFPGRVKLFRGDNGSQILHAFLHFSAPSPSLQAQAREELKKAAT